ncbi:MAG: electron transfer flavoprotein subunit alpha/FixB family protein [Catenulisporales bacterium]|nr:electron transfer flavoprotein subunit alpha/FixB family protein [Catenulisporales bacterium]
MRKVLTLVDRERDGAVRRSACALLTIARRLGEPVAVVDGPADPELIKTLGHFGASEIYCLPESTHADSRIESAESAESAESVRGPQSSASTTAAEPLPLLDSAAATSGSQSAPTATDLLHHLAILLDPAAILITAGYRGQETAARLAIRLDSGIITNAVDVRPGPDNTPIAVQRCLAGSYLVESTVVRGVPVITVRPEAARPEPFPATPAVHTVRVDPSPNPVPSVAATPEPRPDRPPLDQADIVVAGGRGIGSRAAFAVLAEVADALGGAVAGSHTAAELGWVPQEARVGLTGKTVHPRLYFACGISGSVRHRAGMQEAKTVVAIGDDPAAPIFHLADLGVLGDARTILPALLAEIRNRKAL